MREISSEYQRTGPFRIKYPKVFQAESLEDMQQFRAQQAHGARERTPFIPNLSYGSQPHTVGTTDLNAIIFLPEVIHYPAMDSQEDIKKLFGLTVHENLGMKLSDATGSINVWSHEHSFLDFPYPTCFDDQLIPGDPIFNKDKWRAWRDISWKKPVVIMAQYSELSKPLREKFKDMFTVHKDEPVTEYYWLLHIDESNGRPIRRRREQRVDLGAPVLKPGELTI